MLSLDTVLPHTDSSSFFPRSAPICHVLFPPHHHQPSQRDSSGLARLSPVLLPSPHNESSRAAYQGLPAPHVRASSVAGSPPLFSTLLSGIAIPLLTSSHLEVMLDHSLPLPPTFGQPSGADGFDSEMSSPFLHCLRPLPTCPGSLSLSFIYTIATTF